MLQARIKKTIRMDPDVKQISKDGTIAISKATELFTQYLALNCYTTASYNKAKGGGKKGVSSLKGNDLFSVIHNTPALQFLRPDFPLSKNSAGNNNNKRNVAATTGSSGGGNAIDSTSSKKAKFFANHSVDPTDAVSIGTL